MDDRALFIDAERQEERQANARHESVAHVQRVDCGCGGDCFACDTANNGPEEESPRQRVTLTSGKIIEWTGPTEELEDYLDTLGVECPDIVSWEDVGEQHRHEEDTMNTTTLYADNDLQQEIIDGILSADLSPDESMSYLHDLSQSSDLYNFFGHMATNDHILRTYNTFKDAIREELAGLQDSGLDLKAALREAFVPHPGYWDYSNHIDFAATCLTHAVWHAAYKLYGRQENA